MKKIFSLIAFAIICQSATASLLPQWLADISTLNVEAKSQHVTFLGLSTSPLTQELREQFEFDPGYYLLVNHVKPDSPADRAGIKAYHILMKLDDQILINEDQLAVLVRSKSGGDSINLTVIRKGKWTPFQ